MEYLQLSLALRKHKMYIFTLQDVRNLFPGEEGKTIKNNLTRWVSKRYFVRLRRDLYEFVERGTESRMPDLYVANRLYEPSYVSLETALSIYSIIPDIAAGVTSVTSRPTRTFKNRYGLFLYRTCQKRAFIGYKLMLYEGLRVLIADKEKALVDFLYFRLHGGQSLDFDAERLNKKILEGLNWRKTFRYAGLFNDRTTGALKKCREYARC